ncbi:MAG: hypothetical protein H6618_02370 [Deltaproteobacteria bacterium]|nr:hypothetical protein [Deltaproteobacteria bacterium]
MRRLFFFVWLSLLLLSCDPEGRKDCAWVLEPEPDLKGKVQEGYIPVCARNRRTMKQDCRLQLRPEQISEYTGKKFRYSDLQVVSVALPRTIRSLKFCE